MPHKFADIDSLRGVPAADCTTMEYALDLTYGGRTLRLQPGATGPGTAECLWQNVQIDRLWRNTAAEAVRVGGIIYNEDTYLWADLYLILFANGVVSTTLHFTNTKLHIKGYDFRGFPYLKIAGGNASGGTDDTEIVPPLANPDCLLDGRAPSRPMRPECRERPEGIKYVDVEMPRDGWRHDLGAAAFNFADTAIMCGKDAPATLQTRDNAVYYTPFERIVNPQKPDAPADLWEPGFARTLRFQFSLSEAAPAVARYVVPAWWYGVCGEPWPGGLLPVRGRFESLVKRTVEQVRGTLRRGAFDGGAAPGSNRGETGYGLMQQAYLTGDPDLYRDALEGCAYWADRAVDHTDYTAHHLDGAWGWKTCAYTKFRDVLFAYLETGDPWMRDTVELTAESYYAWFRSNWRHKLVYRTTARMWAPAYLLVPKALFRARAGAPEVLAIHGHGRGGGDLVGLTTEQKPGDNPNHNYALEVVRRGMIAFVPELRGFGQRAVDEDQLARINRERGVPEEAALRRDMCNVQDLKANLLGYTFMRLQLHDLSAALDVLEARPEVNPARIGACGLSTGGMMTLFLAALDRRIQAAIISGTLTSYRSYAFQIETTCGSQLPHGLLRWGDLAEVGCLLAPRPVCFESGARDHGFLADVAKGEFRRVKRCYEMAGVPERALFDAFPGGHEWHGAVGLPMLEAWLKR